MFRDIATQMSGQGSLFGIVFRQWREMQCGQKDERIPEKLQNRQYSITSELLTAESIGYYSFYFTQSTYFWRLLPFTFPFQTVNGLFLTC